MVSLDFVLKLSEYNHCEESQTRIELKNEVGETVFFHELSTEDFSDAHTQVGHLFTVSMEAEASSYDALVTYSDSRAEEPAFASIEAAYSGFEITECKIQVVDFCMLDANSDGTTGTFEFELDVRASTACSSLDAYLDIIQGNSYLQNVVLNQADIQEALDCECLTQISATADFDGLTGEDFYGQIDIRDNASDMVYLEDSCTYTFRVYETLADENDTGATTGAIDMF